MGPVLSCMDIMSWPWQKRAVLKKENRLPWWMQPQSWGWRHKATQTRMQLCRLWQSPISRDACKHQHSSTHYPHYQHVHRRRLEARKEVSWWHRLFLLPFILQHVHYLTLSNSPHSKFRHQCSCPTNCVHTSRPLITSRLIHCDLPLSLEGVWHGEAILLLPISTSHVLFRHLIQSLREPWFHHHHLWAVLGVGGAWVRVSFKLSFYHFKMFSFSLVFSFDCSF